ncbi:MAG: PKD domain-containing protein [Bacteroidia bacterium]
MKNAFFRLSRFRTLLFFIIIIQFTVAGKMVAQCGPVISTFPYSEGFETVPAWTSGGTNNDWAWGTPAHLSISSAGGGSKSWCAGGLTGTFYNLAEQAWIMSPCFDFSTLNKPWISFKIYWECERQWDGATFQYSLNGGTTWSNVGAFGDPVDCLNQNWFNYGNISGLNSLPAGTRQGWSGRTGPTVSSCVGGFGSNGWVTAKHCMPNLANQPNVRFRFLMGSGTTCNSYDGIAVDDIFIDNVAPNVSNFSFTCIGNTLNFANLSTPCPTNYSWNFGDPSSSSNTSTAINPSHTYSTGGSYTVTLIANGPCVATGTVSIPVTILTTTASSTNVTCNGSNNGTATATPSGVGPFTYVWSPGGQTTPTATGLSPGTYTVTVNAPGSCAATASVTITQPSLITASQSQVNVSCNTACNGMANVIASGGITPYTYLWSPSGGTNATAVSLCAGNYTCTITDFNGCMLGKTFTITQPSALVTVQSQTNILCNAACNGNANVTISGGVSPYSYQWSPSGGTASAASSLCAGNYTCLVTDADFCQTTASFIITQPSVLSVNATSTPEVCGGSNGTATANPSGGTASYTYQWAPSGGTNATAASLVAGSYTCTITDANGCSASAIATVAAGGGITTTISSLIDVTCNGGNNGSATAAVSGGSGPYNYTWSPSGGNASTATGLIAGNYSVAVTDAFGCMSSATVIITQPPALAAMQFQTDVLCNAACNGSASSAVTGGVAPYTYAWSPSGGTAAAANSLCAGNYSCLITDANGCLLTLTFTITEPNALTLSVTASDASCFNTCDGQVAVTPSGGTTAYSFAWSTGCTTSACNAVCAGSYSVTVSDANGCSAAASITVSQPAQLFITTSATDAHCNLPDGSVAANATGGTGTISYQWISGPSTSGWNNLSANTYSVIATDQNNCSDTSAATVNNLNGVTASLTSQIDLSCFNSNNGALVFTPSGGNGPYTFAWTPNVSSSNSATGLAAGNYQVTITDSNGCSTTQTTIITQPAQLTIIANANTASVCAGTAVQLSSNGNGGTPAYTYAWMPGPLAGSNQNIIPSVTTTYTAYIADVNGCSDSATVLVVVNPVPQADFVADVISGCAPVCVNFTDLSTVISPDIIAAWEWDFGDGSPLATVQNPAHCFSDAGSYAVALNISTTGGCNASFNFPGYINVFANPVAAFGASPQPTTILNPHITFSDSSSNAVSWSWSFGDLSNSTSNLQNPEFTYADPNCYQAVLTVTSSEGCTDIETHEVCIKPEVTLYVPNSFTPNGDGKNDLFFPVGLNLIDEDYELMIFDRWGNLIFKSEQLSKGWDGTVNNGSEIVEEGTYVWKMNVRDSSGQQHFLTGHINLIR